MSHFNGLLFGSGVARSRSVLPIDDVYFHQVAKKSVIITVVVVVCFCLFVFCF